MLRKIRILLAALCFIGITLLLCDFTGITHAYLGYLAKVQLLPAILAGNAAVIAALVLLTLIFGRVYCSVICPLGVMQDIFAWAGRRGKKKNRFKYSWSPAKNVLRLVILIVMIASIALGFSALTALLAPYSAYGRIASQFLAPLYALGNNLLAVWAEKRASYAFYPTEVWGKALGTVIVAAVTLVSLAVLAWKNGRTYCNTVCPVGTALGLLSQFAMLRPVIDKSKCTGCRLCERGCKAACINIKNKTIDRSRCVACFDCISNCRQGAISYKFSWGRKKDAALKGAGAVGAAAHKAAADSSACPASQGRRAFMAGAALLGASALHAQSSKLPRQNALTLAAKNNPAPATRITPPGSISLRNMHKRCIACQLCVQACPGNVLVPSMNPERFMQPEMRYNETYCRPECNACSSVCPAGAIRPISLEEKSSTQIGHAEYHGELCIPVTVGDKCDNCARHCPAGAITMVDYTVSEGVTVQVPSVDRSRCIGCGACQALCPARPKSAIRVEGHEVHKLI